MVLFYFFYTKIMFYIYLKIKTIKMFNKHLKILTIPFFSLPPATKYMIAHVVSFLYFQYHLHHKSFLMNVLQKIIPLLLHGNHLVTPLFKVMYWSWMMVVVVNLRWVSSLNCNQFSKAITISSSSIL